MSRILQIMKTSALRHRGVSYFRQATGCLVLTALLWTPLCQDLAFSQIAAPFDTCSAKRPAFLRSTTLAAGQVAAATMFAEGNGPLGDRSLVLWNIGNASSVPPNTDWSTYFSPDRYYSHSSWTWGNLGDVFGLTFDDVGNMYVSGTRIYGSGRYGTAGNLYGDPLCGALGGVYQIDGSTGQAQPWYLFPKAHCAGLGNITFDKLRQSFYISNFDDGKIYRLDSSRTNIQD